jgi:hypothetical protein
MSSAFVLCTSGGWEEHLGLAHLCACLHMQTIHAWSLSACVKRYPFPWFTSSVAEASFCKPCYTSPVLWGKFEHNYEWLILVRTRSTSTHELLPPRTKQFQFTDETWNIKHSVSLACLLRVCNIVCRFGNSNCLVQRNELRAGERETEGRTQTGRPKLLRTTEWNLIKNH